MKAGVYGPIDSSILEQYRIECNRCWPHANLFQINSSSQCDQSNILMCSSCDWQTCG